ncbi:MAG: sensor histidine kinase [Actinomycetes bacterium]
MLPAYFRSVWDEPRVPNAPVRVWRDWALIGALVVSALLEGTLRSDVVWRPLALALALGLVWALLWRRTRPLATLAVVFGVLTAVSVASIVAGTEPVGLYSTAYILLLPYALLRWGSGREVLLGVPIMLVTYALGIAADYTGAGEAIGGFVFGLFPAVLGALVRFLYGYQASQRDKIKSRERAELARELHDTVAHHVSAIAVRAQAGRVVAATDVRAAIDSLQIIEEEASRALTEMRLMVGTLREDEAAELAPQRGVNDIPSLADDAGASPPVRVELTGPLEDVGASVGAAMYRLAQESITNARRHARHATRVDVRVEGGEGFVHLTVTDDGEPQASAPSWTGYGLVGMRERAALLGGTLDAGPTPGKGWSVTAVLPKVPMS